MINAQYAMSIEDLKRFDDLKESSAYREYIKTLVGSPIFKKIAEEHIQNIDATNDIKTLQDELKLTPSELNKVFKNTLQKMVISIMADTILMKEIAEVGVNDVKDGLETDFKITYLLGLADVKYYRKAEEILKENPDTNSVIYRGYVAYKARNPGKKERVELEVPPRKKKMSQKKPEASSIDIDSDNIEL